MRHFLRYIFCLCMVLAFQSQVKAQSPADTATAKRLGDSAENRMLAGDYNGATNLYTLQMKTGLKLGVFWYNRANAESFLTDYIHATKDYDTALSLDSTLVLAYMNQAYMYMQMRQVDAAMKDYAIGLNKSLDSTNRSNMYISRGNAYMSMNRYVDAEPDFTNGIRYNPKNFQARLQRGAVRRKLKKYKQALEDLNIGYKMQPKNADLLLLRGIVKCESGNYKAAIPDITASLKIKKSNEAWFWRGQARLKLGQDSLARNDFNSILQNDKKNIGALNGRAEANFKMKHPKLALKDYSAVVDLIPDKGEAYANRAFVLTQMGETAKACPDWHKAAELGVEAAKEAIKKYCGK